MAKEAYLYPLIVLLLLIHVSAQLLQLPPPTGLFTIGTVEVQIHDSGRLDVLAPTPNIPRTFMVQVFYPAKYSTLHTLYYAVPYIKQHAALAYEAAKGLQAGTLSALQSNSLPGATLYVADGNLTNIIVFSPGFQISRVFYTSILEDLASKGYVVVAIDHTYDAEAVEMADGSVATGRFVGVPEADLDLSEVAQAFTARTEDVVYVLNEVREIMAHVPGFTDFVDIGGLAVFGHSFGGAAAAEVCWLDGRVLGGLNMDGDFYGEVVGKGLNKPFMYMDSAHGDDVIRSPAQVEVWERLRSWRRHVRVSGLRHMGYSDFPMLIELLGLAQEIPEDVYEDLYGAAEAARSALVVKTFVAAFFDFLFTGVKSVLLSNELNEEWPEVSFPMGRDFR
ncbi:uncharacterized protein LAJ45_06311 [Morchella importuna]|uniref:uncharacterized protein n=1 Tax=Morchella importuna TaxID=1174673 RepID=UPI001E8E4980|nr:uncharacterized protein LAJ45_06311 [Morchella importuna]KAH8149680.1 hypothetical protein LAJ45_06311 [Morchella importuna]